jgi:surface antigen
MFRRNTPFAAVVALALSATLAAPAVLSDPPSHAPAHGWRKKHDSYYLGYDDYRWNRDYGIRDGHCDRSKVGTVVGAVIGGAVGSTVGKGDSKLIAILVGGAIGAVVGREISRDMDSSDRACIGHALELGEDGRRISWYGARPGLSYALTPTGGFERDGRDCRNFMLVREYEGHSRSRRARACRIEEGEWQLFG